MKRLANLFLAALLAFAPLAQADLRAVGTGAPSGTFTQAQQIASAQALGVPFVIAKSAIPFIKASSGTMGNNGAMSALTTLPTTYSGGAWTWLPAGAIAAGVPAAAAWTWCVYSSTTAATCFNSFYTSGVPTLGTQTAFVTTGPGAFIGDTGSITGPTYTIPGGTMGANGVFWAREKWSATNNVGVKSKTTTFGASAITAAISLASTVSWQDLQTVENRGSQALQIMSINAATITGVGQGGASALLFRTVDTSGNVTVARTMVASGAATDNVVLESFTDLVMFGQ